MYTQRHSFPRPQAFAAAFLLGFTCIILWTLTLSSSVPDLAYNLDQQPFNDFPLKIWQTWQTFEDGPQDIGEEYERLSKTWIDMNREYRYELLRRGSASTYVQDHFRSRPDIIETFERLGDPILRADLIRYLTLLAEGGVYSDIDTDCSRPIRDWIPKEYHNKSNLVLGIEYDARGQEVREDLKAPVQLCQWTLMSKPGHPVIQHLLDRVVSQVKTLGEGQNEIHPQNVDDVLESTGPRVFTAAILEALTARTGRPVTYKELSYVDSPRLIGDVLILPISAFASGQDHSGSKPWGNEEQLVSHHWRGIQGWRSRLGE